jgi:putative transcriptional regulator
MNRIKEVLEEKGIKQIWLAEKLGKSYDMLNFYVQNRQQPILEVLFDIAKILKKIGSKNTIHSFNSSLTIHKIQMANFLISQSADSQIKPFS